MFEALNFFMVYNSIKELFLRANCQLWKGWVGNYIIECLQTLTNKLWNEGLKDDIY